MPSTRHFLESFAAQISDSFLKKMFMGKEYSPVVAWVWSALDMIPSTAKKVYYEHLQTYRKYRKAHRLI
jgi:hypothetical protein